MGRNVGSGQGSIYRRGDKWRGQIMINGQRYSHTAEKKSDVIKWLASVRSENINPLAKDYTVEEWMEIYFERWYKNRVRENTYFNNVNLVRNHLYPVLGDVLIKDLTSAMIQDAYPKMFKRKETKKYRKCNYSDGTIKMFVVRFKDGLDYAVEEGVISSNPHKRVIVPKTGVTRIVEAFTPEEQRKIVEYTRSKDDINRVFYLLIATGMRVGECIALTWDDVNIEDGWIEVNKTAVNLRGHMVIHPTKTEQSVRRIYLSDNTLTFIKRLSSNKRRPKLLLPNSTGDIYQTSALRSRWVKVCAELEIPYKNLHALRHSWATRALENGIEVSTVSKMLGHKSIATTIDIYQSVFAEQKKEAAKKMNSVV